MVTSEQTIRVHVDLEELQEALVRLPDDALDRLADRLADRVEQKLRRRERLRGR